MGLEPGRRAGPLLWKVALLMGYVDDNAADMLVLVRSSDLQSSFDSEYPVKPPFSYALWGGSRVIRMRHQ